MRGVDLAGAASAQARFEQQPAPDIGFKMRIGGGCGQLHFVQQYLREKQTA